MFPCLNHVFIHIVCLQRYQFQHPGRLSVSDPAGKCFKTARRNAKSNWQAPVPVSCVSGNQFRFVVYHAHVRLALLPAVLPGDTGWLCLLQCGKLTILRSAMRGGDLVYQSPTAGVLHAARLRQAAIAALRCRKAFLQTLFL